MRHHQIQDMADQSKRTWMFSLVFGFVVTILASFCSGAASAEDADYHLQVGDTIEIWVGQDPALNRKVTVGPDGRISMPLAGHIEVDGLTLQEAEASLAERFRPNFKDKVDVTVMLVGLTGQELTPTVFLVGDVAQPGQYPFQRGMTVLHALSMAGGVYRPANALVPASTGAIDSLVGLKRRLAVALLRSSRVTAELDDHATMKTPDEVAPLRTDPLVVHAEQQEQLVFEVRRSIRRRELESRDREQAALRSEISALRAQVKLNETQITLAEKEQESVQTLMERGLTPAARGMSMERSIAEIQAGRAQIEADLSKAESSLEGSLAEATALEDERRLSLLAERGQLDTEINELGRIVSELEADAAQSSGMNSSLHRYSILRREDDKTVEFAAHELTQIQPSDLIRVRNLSPAQAINSLAPNTLDSTATQSGEPDEYGLSNSSMPSSN